MTKSEKIETIVTTIFLGFCFAVLFNLFFLAFHHSPRVTYFLFAPGNSMFGDYYSVYNAIKSHDPYLGSPDGGVYFPFTYLIFMPFSFLPKHSTATYYTLFFMAALAMFNRLFILKDMSATQPMKQNLFSQWLSIRSFFALTLMTYPALWVILSGNVEGYLFIFLASFIYCYQQKRYTTSAIFLSFAIAMKLYPAVFVFLFLSDKRYKDIILISIVTLSISALPFFFFKSNPIECLAGFAHNLHWFKSYFVETSNGLTFGVSLFSALRVLSHAIHHYDYHYLVPVSAAHMQYYVILVLSLFAIIAIHILYTEKALWKKVFFLTSCMILFPQIGFSYKLISLYLPLYLFVNSHDDIDTSRLANLTYAIILGLLMVPKEFFNIAGESTSVLLTPALLILMIGIAMARSLKLSVTEPSLNLAQQN